MLNYDIFLSVLQVYEEPLFFEDPPSKLKIKSIIIINNNK